MARRKRHWQQKPARSKANSAYEAVSSDRQAEPKKLEVVLKGDVSGTVEAVAASIAGIEVPGVDIRVIQSGVGPIIKSDILMAETGSRLVIGFNVDVVAKLQEHIVSHCVEVRLYKVIYKLVEDTKRLARMQIISAPEEVISGRANVIATFKNKRKGVILGCEITSGTMEVGRRFRVITAMGPVYTGRIESLQIERRQVKTGKTGQQVGLKIDNWKNAKVGDIVECFEPPLGRKEVWQPSCGIFKPGA